METITSKPVATEKERGILFPQLKIGSNESSLRRAATFASFLINENLLPRRVERQPEPDAVMDEENQAVIWHDLGAPGSPIEPVYHFAARAVAALCPRNGCVVDLGCGSGQFLAHLARLRPDIRGVGLDLSLSMVEVGNRSLQAEGLSSKIELRLGNMTRFAHQVPKETAVVTSVFALHHLPTENHLRSAFNQMKRVRHQTGAALWLFDLARPRREGTVAGYNRVFSPNAAEIFHRDSINSLRAAFSFGEMAQAVAERFGTDVHSHRARLLPLYQVHWVPPTTPIQGFPAVFEISGEHRKVFKSLHWAFPHISLAPVEKTVLPDTAATLPQFAEHMARQFPLDTVFFHQPAGAKPQPVEWRQFHQSVQSFSRGLTWLGLLAGERVGLFMANRAEWDVSQFAVMASGGVVVGLDPNAPPEATAEIVRRSDCRGIILPSPEEMTGWNADSLSRLKWVVTLNALASSKQGGRLVLSRDTLIEAARTTPPVPVRVLPEDPAILVYTSGTTGQPKGRLYTHAQLSFVRRTLADLFVDNGPGDLTLAWLPLSNLFQRIWNLAAMDRRVPYHYVANPREIMKWISRLKPTLLLGVPRFFEKGRQGILSFFPGPLGRWFEKMLGFAGEMRKQDRVRSSVSIGKKFFFGILNHSVFAILRRVWGGRLRLIVSGSAPCPEKILAFFEALGLPISEAYGVSECLLPVSMNRPGECRSGSVGKPLPGQDISIAPDGEVFIRGAALHQTDTGELPALTEDGYWATGDLGRMDEDGFLFLVGRRSEVIKMSNGRSIPLPALEMRFRQMKGIDQCVIMGHGRARLVACATPVAGTSPESKALKKEMARINASLPRHEQLAGLLLLSSGFSMTRGEVTPNLKLRRDVIENNYRSQIESLARGTDSVLEMS